MEVLEFVKSLIQLDCCYCHSLGWLGPGQGGGEEDEADGADEGEGNHQNIQVDENKEKAEQTIRRQSNDKEKERRMSRRR